MSWNVMNDRDLEKKKRAMKLKRKKEDKWKKQVKK